MIFIEFSFRKITLSEKKVMFATPLFRKATAPVYNASNTNGLYEFPKKKKKNVY